MTKYFPSTKIFMMSASPVFVVVVYMTKLWGLVLGLNYSRLFTELQSEETHSYEYFCSHLTISRHFPIPIVLETL